MTLLRDVAFDDLYLNTNIDKSKIRGLDGDQSLRTVPNNLREDLARLEGAIQAGQADHPDAVEFSVQYDDAIYRVAVIRDMLGVVYALRRGRKDIPSISSFHLDAAIVDRLMSFRAGMVLISGAFRTGKTTLASSYALAFSKTGGLVISLEDPPELVLSGEHGDGQILQVQIDRGDIELAVQRTLRTSFDMLFISEIRTSMMASELISASTNGKLVLSTIHADSPIGALTRLVTLARGHNGGESTDAETVHNNLAQGLAIVLHLDLDDDGRRRVTGIIVNNRSVKAKLTSGSLKSLQEDVNQIKARLKNNMPIEF